MIRLFDGFLAIIGLFALPLLYPWVFYVIVKELGLI
jgi:hypothetical protein